MSALEEFVKQVTSATVVRPGDRVLLTLLDGPSSNPVTMAQMGEFLGERFPGVDFTFVNGITGIAVERGQ